MDLIRLKDKFPYEDIEWRVGRSGMANGKPWAIVLAYVSNRAIMERLDEVCGPKHWYNEFKSGPDGGVLCGISIKVFETSDEWTGPWITKWDGAENSEYEPVKGGLSNAMKRAGVQWGIGRYLYKLPILFAIIVDPRPGDERPLHKDCIKENGKKVWFSWNPPPLPQEALPEGEK